MHNRVTAKRFRTRCFLFVYFISNFVCALQNSDNGACALLFVSLVEMSEPINCFSLPCRCYSCNLKQVSFSLSRFIRARSIHGNFMAESRHITHSYTASEFSEYLNWTTTIHSTIRSHILRRALIRVLPRCINNNAECAHFGLYPIRWCFIPWPKPSDTYNNFCITHIISLYDCAFPYTWQPTWSIYVCVCVVVQNTSNNVIWAISLGFVHFEPTNQKETS